MTFLKETVRHRQCPLVAEKEEGEKEELLTASLSLEWPEGNLVGGCLAAVLLLVPIQATLVEG